MITDKKVAVKITKSNFEFYSKLGYDISIGDIFEIKSCDIKKTSAIKIIASCDSCGDNRCIMAYNYYNQIKKGNFYVCQKCNNVKSRITNLKKYGFECPLQNLEIAKKSKNSLIKNYGVDNISKLIEIRESRRDNFRNLNFKIKSKKTWVEKYGVENPSMSEEIKDKKRKTMIDVWGCENPSQSSIIFEKSQKSGKKLNLHELGIYYRGSYEKHFLDFCLSKSIRVEKGKTIEYSFGGKKKYYHSDFFLPEYNLICEIKSSYYYFKYEIINLAKKNQSEKKGNFLFIIDKDYSDLLSLFVNE